MKKPWLNPEPVVKPKTMKNHTGSKTMGVSGSAKKPWLNHKTSETMKISLKPNQKQNHTRVGRSLVGYCVPGFGTSFSAAFRSWDSLKYLPAGDARILSILLRTSTEGSSPYVTALSTTRQQNATVGFDHCLAPSCKNHD